MDVSPNISEQSKLKHDVTDPTTLISNNVNQFYFQVCFEHCVRTQQRSPGSSGIEGNVLKILLEWMAVKGAWWTLGPRLLFPLHPSYDSHRQFDYGVCVQHFGEHVSDDRRKRGRKEEDHWESWHATERGNLSRMRTPMWGKVPISLLVGGRTEWVIRSIFLGLLL